MDAWSKLLALPEEEKARRGLAHTPAEIRQQPDTWGRSYNTIAAHADEVGEFLTRAGVPVEAGDRATLYLVGAGTSDYIGRALTSILRRQWGCETQAVASTDLLTNTDEYVIPGRPYLWVSFSRSGDSSEGVSVIEQALERYPQIHHLIVTCNRQGRMARDYSGPPNVFCVVLDDAVNDRGLAMTSSFTNMVVSGQCLAHVRDLHAYQSTLEALTTAGRSFLERAADAAEKLAAKRFKKVCFLGTGALKAVAVESALKLVELTAGRILTWSESFLGVRHGPLSAVDDETLVVSFLSGDARRRSYEMDLLREVNSKRLAGQLVSVWPREPAPGEDFGESLSLGLEGPVEDLYRPPLDVIFGQLFGLFSSLEHGLTPDTPSPKEAISRVVTQVHIY